MKKLFTLFTLFCLPFLGVGQDCKDVNKHYNDLKAETTFTTPYFSTITGSVSANKYIKPDYTLASVYFVIYGAIPDYNAKGIFIKFEDGTIYKVEESKVDCGYAAGRYIFSGFITLDEDNIELFTKKKIVKYGLDDFVREMPEKHAKKLPEIFNCIYSSK